MRNDQVTRRLFVKGASALAGNSALRAAMPGVFALAEAACTAREQATGFTTLSDAEAAEFEAIAARILPATDSPGAVEAGVIWFMDNAFATLMQDQLGAARQGLDELQATLGGKLFSTLDDATQDRHLADIEGTQFFALLRNMTIYGYFGMSRYGGNRDNVGWRLLGVADPRHTWQPPFGYYDAEYMRGEQNGE